MTTTHPLARLARTALDSTAPATALAAAGTAMLLADRTLPRTWSRAPRLLVAGAIGLVTAIAAEGAADTAFAPARRQLTDTINDRALRRAPSAKATVTVGTAQEVRDELGKATVLDAAERAALVANRLDKSEDSFLHDADRWQGRTDGQASLFLIDGLVLHFVPGEDGYGGTFTLLSSKADQPVKVTSLAQLRLAVDADLAGLPAARPLPGGEDRRKEGSASVLTIPGPIPASV